MRVLQIETIDVHISSIISNVRHNLCGSFFTFSIFIRHMLSKRNFHLLKPFERKLALTGVGGVNEMKQVRLIKKHKRECPAFEKLMLMYQERLYKTAFLYTRNKEDSLDAVQETVIKAFKHLSGLKRTGVFSSWLTRILIHTIFAMKKSSKMLFRLNSIMRALSDMIFRRQARFKTCT